MLHESMILFRDHRDVFLTKCFNSVTMIMLFSYVGIAGIEYILGNSLVMSSDSKWWLDDLVLNSYAGLNLCYSTLIFKVLFNLACGISIAITTVLSHSRVGLDKIHSNTDCSSDFIAGSHRYLGLWFGFLWPHLDMIPNLSSTAGLLLRGLSQCCKSLFFFFDKRLD